MNVFDDSTWSGWRSIPDGRTGGDTNVALAATEYNRHLYVLAEGLKDNHVYVDTFDGSTWSGWDQIPGQGFTDVLLAATGYNGHLYVFEKGLHSTSIYANMLT